MAVKWKWKPAAGGSVPTELQNKVNQNETKINTIEQKYVKKDEANTFTAANTFNTGNNLLTYTSTNTTNKQNITNLQQNTTTKQYVDNRIKKRVLTITNTQGNTYTIQPTAGYEIISLMVGRKRTAEGYYFFNYQSTLNFQLFMDMNGAYKLYTEGPVSGFNGDYKIIVVEMKV